MTGSKYDFLKKQMKGNYGYLFSAVFFILIGSFFSFSGPKLVGVAVDSIIGTSPFDLPQFLVDIINSLGGREYFIQNIWIVICVFVAIKLIEAFCEYSRLNASNYLGENLGYNMRQAIFERLQSATFAYHKGIYTGDIIQRCSYNVQNLIFKTGRTPGIRKCFDEFHILCRIGHASASIFFHQSDHLQGHSSLYGGYLCLL